MTRVALVEYGVGNVMSVANALRRVGCVAHIVSDGQALNDIEPDAIVMPGVGAVGESLELLDRRELKSALSQQVIERRIPFLGICVGMQVIFEHCNEFGQHLGLGWIGGYTDRLDTGIEKLSIPHVGWNNIEAQDGTFLATLSGEHFYFVHSNAAYCRSDYVSATATYGQKFTAAVELGNVFGVQFHPEKSSGSGERLFKMFIDHAEALKTDA